MDLDVRKRWDESDRKLFEQTLAMLGHSPVGRGLPPLEAVKAELEWLRETVAENLVERHRIHKGRGGHKAAPEAEKITG